MKTLVLSFIILSISILQHIVDRPNVNEIDYAIRILKILQRDNKSFCILSNNDLSNSSDQSYFKGVMNELNSQYAAYNDELAEEDTEIIIQNYVEFFKNENRFFKILAFNLVSSDCRVLKVEKNNLSKLLIDDLITQKNNIKIYNSGEMLGISCKYEMYYKDLIEYSGYVNRSEKFFIDIFIFNFATKKRMEDSTHITSNHLLIKQAHKFIQSILRSGQKLSISVTICLVSKSLIDYYKNQLQSILRYYIIIVNELKNNESEMCELSNLKTNRLEQLKHIFNVTGKLDEIQTGGILLGFEQFFENMDNTHIYLHLNLYPNSYKYISRQCDFDRQQFLNDYTDMINDVLNNFDSELSDRHAIELMKYCILTNIRNKNQVKVDDTIQSKISEIINAYDSFTYTFLGNLCEDNFNLCHKMTINNLRSDSEEIDLMNRNCYLNKLILYCKVQSYQNKDLNYHYLDILYNFLFKYTYSFCPYKSSNVKLFADGISQDLFGIRNDKIVSLSSIENYVSDFLNLCDNNINVTYFSLFEYQTDYCHIKNKINYTLIDFGDIDIDNPDYEYIKDRILHKCSLIHSITKYIDDFNSYINLDDWLLLLDTRLNFINNVSYIFLTDNEKFNFLKYSIYSNLTAYKLSQGNQKRMDCEIERITKKGFEDLSIDKMKSIYLHLAFKYSNSNCLLDASMFRKKKIQNLVSYLKKYPNFDFLDDSKIKAYILYLNRIILNVSTQLLSYDYPDILALKLIDPFSCRYQTTFDELNTIVLTYLENKYKDKEILWMNHVHFYKCLLLKDTRSFLSELYNNNQLSSKEIENITDLYHSTLAAHPNVNKTNVDNRTAIMELLINTSKLINYVSNPIKLSMVYCHIRKPDTIIVIHSTPSESSSTTSTMQSSTSYTEESSTADAVLTSAPYKLNQSSINSTITSISNGFSITQSTIKPELSKGAIAGIVTGMVAIIFIFVCFMIYYFYFYRRKIIN